MEYKLTKHSLCRYLRLTRVNVDVIAVPVLANSILSIDMHANLRLFDVGEEHFKWDRLEEHVTSPLVK